MNSFIRNIKITRELNLPEEVEELVLEDRELEYRLLAKRLLPWKAINIKECLSLLERRTKIITKLLKFCPIAIQYCQPPCFTEVELGKNCLAIWTLYIPNEQEAIEIKGITDTGIEPIGIVPLKDIAEILTIALDGFNTELFLVKSLKPKLELIRAPHDQELLLKITEEEKQKHFPRLG